MADEKNGTLVEAPDALQPSTVDYSALFQKAMAMDTETPTKAAVTEKPAPAVGHPQLPSVAEVAQKVEQQQEKSAVVEPTVKEDIVAPVKEDVTPAEQNILELPDTALIKVKYKGQEEVVSVKEYKDSIQRGMDYTRSKQQLADQRRQVEQELAQQYAQLQSYAQALAIAKQEMENNNPLQKLSQLVEQKAKQEQDPNTIATLGDFKKALDEYRQEVAQQLNERDQKHQQAQQQALMELQQRQEIASDAQKFSSAMAHEDLAKDFQIVRSAVPNPEIADAIVRFNVAQMEPETIDQGIEFMRQFVQQWAQNVRSQQQQEKQKESAQRARATMEDPKGSPPSPAPPATAKSVFRKDGTVDWNSLHERASNMLG